MDRFLRLMQCLNASFPEDAGQLYCNSSWDTVSCWPTTLVGQVAVLPCPDYVDGIKYDSSRNASRACFDNGTWQLRSDYSQCQPLPDGPNAIHNYAIRVIYYVGFTISIVALIVALSIFLYFRTLRCLRNTIHCHLIVTFILRNLLWLVMNSALQELNKQEKNDIHKWVCKIIVAVYNYLQMTNFFWMLVEGLYLHTMIVWAFSIEKIPFWSYLLLGWGFPALVIVIWAVVKANYENVKCWLPMKDTFYDYVYLTPILLVLLINVLFLASILWVLVTKLRASNTLQTRQYKKAVKATLILLPLLGVTHVLLITPPGDDLISKTIFVYFNAVLQSTQGLAVSVFYCFLNGEVRSTIKQKFSRWQDGRSVATRYTRASIAVSGEAINMGARGSLLSTNSAGALTTATTATTPNGRVSITSSNKDFALRSPHGNNNENGFSHMSSTPMLRDEAL